jgi:hypothetical protein
VEYGIICGTETERVIRVPTTGVFDFESLVKIEKAKYVDKTKYFWGQTPRQCVFSHVLRR